MAHTIMVYIPMISRTMDNLPHTIQHSALQLSCTRPPQAHSLTNLDRTRTYIAHGRRLLQTYVAYASSGTSHAITESPALNHEYNHWEQQQGRPDSPWPADRSRTLGRYYTQAEATTSRYAFDRLLRGLYWVKIGSMVSCITVLEIQCLQTLGKEAHPWRKERLKRAQCRRIDAACLHCAD